MDYVVEPPLAEFIEDQMTCEFIVLFHVYHTKTVRVIIQQAALLHACKFSLVPLGLPVRVLTQARAAQESNGEGYEVENTGVLETTVEERTGAMKA